jgi:putative transposase
MNTAEKVNLVETVEDQYDLRMALSAVQLPKSTWYYHQNQKQSYQEKYEHLHPKLEEIACEHPEYGIPRITKELQDTYQIVINHKVVQRLLRLWRLSLVRNIRAPKPSGIQKAIKTAGKRANLVSGRENISLFDVVYTDFTELVYADGTAKAHLMVILGHVCKMVFGWAVGERANTQLALKAWSRAKQTFKEYGIPCKGLIMHHDQDSVYTSYRWARRLLAKDKVQLSYALNGAKDNPEIESFNGRFKTENRSLFLDAQNLNELHKIVEERIEYYNQERRHSSIDYLSPAMYLQKRFLKGG